MLKQFSEQFYSNTLDLSRVMSHMRVQIINQFEREPHGYKTIKRYWKLIQQDCCKLSAKRFYRPTFRMHMTNKEILDKLLSFYAPI